MAHAVALIIDEDTTSLRRNVRLLEGEGFDVVAAPDARTGMRLAGTRQPQVALVVGRADPRVCAGIRQISQAYVILASESMTPADRLQGLTLGIDDYLPEHFAAADLADTLGRMRQRARRATPAPTRHFGGLSIRPTARQVSLDDRELDLTRIEFDLIATLSGEPGRVFTRRQLLDAAWGPDWSGDQHVVDVHIGNLRRKLGESGGSPRFIHTVRGQGFRFDAVP